MLIVEALPGQFDQRADSCAQCIQLLADCDLLLVKAATVYVLMGMLTAGDLEKISRYLINPVESREASADKPETLVQSYDVPTKVATLDGFIRRKTRKSCGKCWRNTAWPWIWTTLRSCRAISGRRAPEPHDYRAAGGGYLLV